jgi:ABC-type cobalamin/Fe3+-siderophores transport system ATPase subunit
MIRVDAARVSAGGRILLRDVSFPVDAGEAIAILGPNGVGKTTLMRAMAGLHPLDEGRITIDGEEIARLAPVERARRVAFVASDDVLLDGLDVHDVVAIGRHPHHRWWEWRTTGDDERAVHDALRAVGMEWAARRRLATLSSGERQRVWIALGLAQETPVLLLDEPTSHLDIRAAHEVLVLLHELARTGKTVVCVLHDPNEAAAFADRIVLLGDGRVLACAPPSEVFAGDLPERAYGIPMERLATRDGGVRLVARFVRERFN